MRRRERQSLPRAIVTGWVRYRLDDGSVVGTGQCDGHEAPDQILDSSVYGLIYTSERVNPNRHVVRDGVLVEREPGERRSYAG